MLLANLFAVRARVSIPQHITHLSNLTAIRACMHARAFSRALVRAQAHTSPQLCEPLSAFS
jgi:hypothetical protein